MDPHISDQRQIFDIEPADSARRRVLETPDLVDCILDYCDMQHLNAISLVNRFFEATSAPRMYRVMTLYPSHWECGTWTTGNGTPTSRQIGYMSYARVFLICCKQDQRIRYDLSSCCFPEVEVVQFFLSSPGSNGTSDTVSLDRYNDQNLAEMLNKIPDFLPNTVVNRTCASFRLDSDVQSNDLLSEYKKCPGTLSPSATRLVTHEGYLWPAIIRFMGADTIAKAVEGIPLLQALYPRLSEIVMWLRCEPTHCSILKLVFLLVENGYKVVLAGYQGRSHDKRHIKKELLNTTAADVPELVADFDQLVDTLADRVHKISLREFYALPYCGYHGPADYIDAEIKREEDYYLDRSIPMRHDSKDNGKQNS